MITNQNIAKVIELIEAKSLKEKGSDDEDFSINDCAGGNIDDAYFLGFDDGQISFARALKETLNK